MDLDIFNLNDWNKNINGKSHEDRVKDWLKNLTKFEINDKTFKYIEDAGSIKFSNLIRPSRIPDSIKNNINNEFTSKDGAGSLFISILGSWGEADTEELGAKYLGTSLVFFPCYKQIDDETRKTKPKKYTSKPSGIIVSIGMGSGGAGNDETLVGNPGHIRRFEGMISSLNLHDKTIPIWWRNDPLAFKPVPSGFIKRTKELLDQSTPYALYWRDETGGYGQYLYANCVLKFDENGNLNNEQKKLLIGFVQFYFRERGWRQNQTNDPALEWYRELFPSNNVDSIKTVLDSQKYVILCGPPGTKKTDMLSQIVGKYKDNISYQFHPSVTYQMFVGGIQPILANSKDGAHGAEKTADVGFEYSVGPLLIAIDKAEKNNGADTLLALDEINRADLSSVLGEAIQLFEPGQKYKLSIKNYNDGKSIEMPDNLKVLATMNTADRNISYIDVAIRRRFAFINIWPDEPNGENSCTYGKEWFNKCKMLFLEYGENSDLLLMPGGYYFLGKADEEVKTCFKYRLIPLLEDYLNENRLTQKMKYELDMYLQELRREI